MNSKLSIRTNLICFFLLLTVTNLNAQTQIPEPKESQGLVVFYRTKSFKAGAIKFTVKDSRGEYGQLTNGSIISVHVEPGSNTFWSQVISSDAITIDVEEGNIYYVKGTVKMGALAGRPKFNLVEESKALKEIDKIE